MSNLSPNQSNSIPKKEKQLKLSILSLFQNDQQVHSTIQLKFSLRANSPQENCTLSPLRFPLMNRVQNVPFSDSNSITHCNSPISIMTVDQHQIVSPKKLVSQPIKPFRIDNKKIKEADYNNMHTNTNSDICLGNYNIQTYYLKSEGSFQAKKKQSKTRGKLKMKPLSVALVSRSSLFRRPLTSAYHHNASPNNCIKSFGYFKKECQRFNYQLGIKEDQEIVLPSMKKEEEKEEKNDFYTIIRKIQNDNRKQVDLNNKSIFKKLKFEIKKNETKIKNILDDLQRTRQLNDEDLKKKVFIKKTKNSDTEFNRNVDI